MLYIHDTVELFAGSLGDLRIIWTDMVRPALRPRVEARMRTSWRRLFQAPSDAVREAALVARGRALSPAALRETCDLGLAEILGP